MKKIVFTVTNDLSFDQRMQRICSSLAKAGYSVLLVGRKLPTSLPLKQEIFQQKRLHCFFTQTFLFYAEYNLRLYFFLLFEKMDAVCAIDLDTILPCYFISVLKRKKRIYDAHELFTEMKEVVTRPRIKKLWTIVEKFAVPKFKFGYTVSYSIAEEFKKGYDVDYAVIRNLPVKKPFAQTQLSGEKIFLYQGAVNEARGLENLIIAMKKVNAPLHIYGNGNAFEKIKLLIKENNVEEKIILKGMVLPSTLDAITQHYYVGINLVEPLGLNQLYSLANKFFDYIQAGVPQLTMSFPEYKRVNDEFEVAVLMTTVQPTEITNALNNLLDDEELHKRLQQNCFAARKIFVWENEEIKLLDLYKQWLA